jgi:hypothetical protein
MIEGMGDMDGAVEVVDCLDCAGLTFVMYPCACQTLGDSAVVDVDGAGFPGLETYRDCVVCRGAGAVARGCATCGELGKRRAQLVVTVADLRTGRVASASVVPDMVDPQPLPDFGHGCDLAGMVDELAGLVGRRPLYTWLSTAPLGEHPPLILRMPEGWNPSLPEPEHQRLKAQAVTRLTETVAWRLYLGLAEPGGAHEQGDQLERLCRLASDLCTDLVVEARRDTNAAAADSLVWQVRLDLPDAPLPTVFSGRANFDAALAAATPEAAFDGLGGASSTAPAYFIEPPTHSEPAGVPAKVVAAEVERLAGPAGAALATWRDGRWTYSELVSAETTEDLRVYETGQVLVTRTPVYRRAVEPPPPASRGEPIPSLLCMRCANGTSLRSCHSCSPSRRDGCQVCHGNGVVASPWCGSCGGTEAIRYGAAVTVTDLAGATVHLDWRADTVDRQQLRTRSAGPGKLDTELPEQFRLTLAAIMCGTTADRLIDPRHGVPVRSDLRDGTTYRHGTHVDPLGAFLEQASRGRPGGRIFLRVARATPATAGELVRLARGLGLTAAVAVKHVSPSLGSSAPEGCSWAFEIGPVRTVVKLLFPHAASLDDAAGSVLKRLPLAVAQSVPEDPTVALAAPQQLGSLPLEEPSGDLTRLAAFYSGRLVQVEWTATDCRIYVDDRDRLLELVATGPTLRQAAEVILGRDPTDR